MDALKEWNSQLKEDVLSFSPSTITKVFKLIIPQIIWILKSVCSAIEIIMWQTKNIFQWSLILKQSWNNFSSFFLYVWTPFEVSVFSTPVERLFYHILPLWWFSTTAKSALNTGCSKKSRSVKQITTVCANISGSWNSKQK